MNLPLWMLLAFSAWTLGLMGMIGLHRWGRIFGGRAELISFPGDRPHGEEAYQRVVRAHANCIENLPVFGALVLVAMVAGLDAPQLGPLSVVVMAARVPQSLVHMIWPISNRTVAVRFSFFLVQFLAMIVMAVLIALAAAAG